MNRGEFKTEVLANVGRVGDTSLSTRLDRWYMRALYRICRAYDFREMNRNTYFNTEAGVKEYELHDRCKDILSVVLVNDTISTKLEYIPPRALDESVPYPEAWATGVPTHYSRYWNQIEMWKIPDAVYRVNVRQSLYPGECTSDGDECIYVRKDDMVAAFMTAETYKLQMENDEYIRWMTDAMRMLKEYKQEEENQPDYAPVARPYGVASVYNGNGWDNPFIKGGNR